jgi:hypothetical protein
MPVFGFLNGSECDQENNVRRRGLKPLPTCRPPLRAAVADSRNHLKQSSTVDDSASLDAVMPASFSTSPAGRAQTQQREQHSATMNFNHAGGAKARRIPKMQVRGADVLSLVW